LKHLAEENNKSTFVKYNLQSRAHKDARTASGARIYARGDAVYIVANINGSTDHISRMEEKALQIISSKIILIHTQYKCSTLSIKIFSFTVYNTNSAMDHPLWDKFEESLVEIHISMAFILMYNKSSSKKSCSKTNRRYNT